MCDYKYMHQIILHHCTYVICITAPTSASTELCTVISHLSLQKIFKKSGFNFFTKLLVFAVSQTYGNQTWGNRNRLVF